jgi:DNA-binding response OmpR family regulator
MNTDCCIRIARENGDRKGSGGKLALCIRGRQVKATPAQIALLACLHEHQGRIVPYAHLGKLLRLKSSRLQQRWILRQYIMWIKRTLAAHNAPCVIAVAPDVGYALCGHLARRLGAIAAR